MKDMLMFKEFMKRHFPNNKVEFGEFHLEKFADYLKNPSLSKEDYQFLECLDLSNYPIDLKIAKDSHNYIEITWDEEIILSTKCKEYLFSALQVGSSYDLNKLKDRYRDDKM